MMADKARPIHPSEVSIRKCETFPEAVFEAFNELIVRGCADNRIVINQDDVVALMLTKGLDRAEIYRNGWLNVEEAYRSVGWKVEYDKSGFGDTYPATFIFTQ